MKVLHIITNLEIGGAQRLLADILPIQSSYCDVALLVSHRVNNTFEQTIEAAGIKIISLNESNLRKPSLVFDIRNIIRTYDVAHVHLFPPLYLVRLAAIGLSVKIVYTEHSTTNRRRKWYFWPLEKFVYSRYNSVISISEQTHHALTRWLHTIDKKYVVVNNGVNLEHFSTVNVPIDSNSLIMVSRFTKEKDQETVIRAMQHLYSNVIIKFVGDGPTRAYCENLAQQLGVSDRIKFLGSRNDVAELIASSYIGIQSSHWEGFGLTAVEIMACGKPIIGSDVDGLKQVIGDAGLVFSVGDEHTLANRINHLLNDKYYYDMVADKCKERAKEFDINTMAQKYVEIYRTLC